MTFATLLPYLLSAAGGFIVRHYDVLGKLGNVLAGPSPVSPSVPTLPLTASSHPVLSDAVSAAIKQAVADVTAGHVANLKSELSAMVQAAVAAAVADLKKT